jgi:hypothetical protein
MHPMSLPQFINGIDISIMLLVHDIPILPFANANHLSNFMRLHLVKIANIPAKHLLIVDVLFIPPPDFLTRRRSGELC